jgi:hypothetical protein
MKKLVSYLRKFEKAQILPIVAIGMFAMIGMAALLLDGGVLMANRRSAQAAADAGALAGARLICQEASAATIEAEALRYAVDLNKADPYPSTTASYDSITGLVTVVAKKEQNSWFARIFGDDTLSTGASASAGCYHPSIAKRVLPIAFYYESPPVNAGAANCNTDGSCALVNWDFYELMNELSATSATNLPLDDIYIVANTTKVCEKPITGAIVCTEMSTNASGGNRTWIDLSELADTNNLKKVIQDGLDQPLYTPAWINGQTGLNAAIYSGSNFSNLASISGYESYPARLLTVPLFDQYCPSGGTCQPVPDPVYDNIRYYLVNENQPAYRFVGFAPFVITCVTKNDKCEFGNCIPAKTGPNTTKKPICPGYLASDPATNPDKSAIEGYFVEGLPADMFAWGTEGVDAGIYIISLSD